MDKRTFLKTASLATVGILLNPLSACNSSTKESNSDSENTATASVAADQSGILTLTAPFSLPALPYAVSALAPNIDEQTMTIHHSKHHQGYVDKLNKAVENTAYSSKNLAQIMKSISQDDTAIRNNGGGHYNHSLFWESLSPSNQVVAGELADAITKDFGSFETFKSEFTDAAKGVFGSGWAWLCKADDGKLFITSTPNQDNPLMTNLVERSGMPLLGIDVWEHAYYLKYQNKRADYIENFYKIINWEKVAERFKA